MTDTKIIVCYVIGDYQGVEFREFPLVTTLELADCVREIDELFGE
jgi:hypothetical protein